MSHPSRPQQLSPYAESVLRALADAGLGHKISVGGGLGLQHYHEYRATHDVDAWWAPGISGADQESVLRVVTETLQRHGVARERRWGEVSSVELLVEGKVAFSFQVAARSSQLAPTTTLPWVDVALDSLADLVASKMVALVERGAPRDFRDIHALCHEELVTTGRCWHLWRERQERSRSDPDLDRARLAIETHLERIAQHRPLAAIADPEVRAAAARLRRWFAEDFLHARLD